jgi:SHS2 domain-containing protein
VRFLNEVIYRMSAHRMVYGEFSASVTEPSGGGDWTLRARIRGEPFDAERHEPTVEPKGATFMLARVEPGPSGGWICQCVVDV